MKVYILIRNDLELTIGKILAHIGHIFYILGSKYSNDGLLKEWEKEDQTKIMLSASSKEIDTICEKLPQDTIIITIEDAGRSGNVKGEKICYLIGPISDEIAKEVGIKKLPLFRAKQ